MLTEVSEECSVSIFRVENMLSMKQAESEKEEETEQNMKVNKRKTKEIRYFFCLTAWI
jgi:hypothetical protein